VERAARRLEAINGELLGLSDEMSSDQWLLTRARVGVLLADFNDSMAEVDHVLGLNSAQSRILRYFQLRLGKTVTKDELSGVAGIHEWARRVRELREDHGWAIHSVNTRDGLAVGEYVLLLDRPDAGLARNWTIARKMRKLKSPGGGVPSVKIRMLEFLKAIYPAFADKEQLAHVAHSTAAAEAALDELSIDGWAIERCPVDDPVTPGGGRLESLNRNSS
jgi:hypothetical protein